MKKSIPVYASLLVLGLIVTGCSNLFAPQSSGPTAPNVGSASTLASSGATTAPTTQTEAVTLANEAMSALTGNATTHAVTSNERATNTSTQTINWNETVGGGTVAMTGTIRTTTTTPDSNNWATNTTYDNYIRTIMAMDMNGTVSNVTLANTAGTNYLISGKIAADVDFDFSVDLKTGATASDVTADLDLSLSIAYGYALSVKRLSDGMGAKIIISFAFQDSVNNASLSDMSSYGTTMNEKLASHLVEVKVYNDANVLIGTYNVPITQLSGIIPL